MANSWGRRGRGPASFRRSGAACGLALRVGLGLAAATIAPLAASSVVHAGDEAPSRAEVDALKQRIEALERELDGERAREGAAADGGAAKPAAAGDGGAAAPDRGANGDAGGPGEAAALTPFYDRERLDTPEALRGVYDKPFLVSLWRRAYVGGYTELEYHAFEDEPLGLPYGFRAHRTNLFVFADVADRIKFGAEIEFENEEPGEDLEVALEMAFVDVAIFQELVIRGGAILAPLGRVNVNHDGPTRDLTDRPLVSRFVIPTTMTEAGIGLHGEIRLGEAVALGYEAYLTNGFSLLDRDGQLPVDLAEREVLLREGRPSLGGDGNRSVATMGRGSVALFDAVEVGGSWHVGRYDERNDHLLSIVAVDLSAAFGPVQIEAEWAWAGFERDAFARTAGIPDRFWGLYAQGSIGGMPGFVRDLVPSVFDDEGARLSAVVRYDLVDLDGDRGEAIEPGVAIRPVADTVLKVSYRFGLQGIGIRGVPGRRDFDDDGFVFGLASYF